MSAPSPIELLSRIAPVSDEEAVNLFGTAGRERLLEAITGLPPTPMPRHRVRRPLLIAFAAVLVATATAAVAWAVSHGAARETTSIECVIAGTDTVIDATSGNPAADCAAEWQRELGTQAPLLIAYANVEGGVTVLPRSEKPPPGWQPLPSQDVALIQLQGSLDDYINGLNSSCLNSSAATAFARRQLDSLGLASWTVNLRSSSQTTPTTGPAPRAAPSPGARPAPTTAPAAQICTAGDIVDPTTTTVTLIPVGVAEPTNWIPRRLATSLQPLTKTCLFLPAMRSEVEQQAGQLGLSPQGNGQPGTRTTYQLNATQDDNVRCTSLYETVGGTINLDLRGPAH